MNLLRKLLLERKGKRPPFLKAPLNAPGASLQEQLNDKFDSFAMGLVSGPAALRTLPTKTGCGSCGWSILI